jgi:carbon storage regulator
MLVLSRKNRESVVIGGTGDGEHLLKVTVIAIRGGSVRLGFDASADVPVHRAEIWERICAENSASRSEGSLPTDEEMGAVL